MAKKISELPVSGPYNGSEKLLMTQDGITTAGYLSSLDVYLGNHFDSSEIAAISSDWTNTFTTVSANSASWGGGGGGGSSTLTVQKLGTIGGPVTFDISLGESSIALLSADTTLTLSNAPSGESGMFVFGHDEVDSTHTLNITSSVPDDYVHVMAGDLADFADPADTGYNIGTVSWFNDGEDYYLYVSDIKQVADPLNLNRQ